MFINRRLYLVSANFRSSLGANFNTYTKKFTIKRTSTQYIYTYIEGGKVLSLHLTGNEKKKIKIKNFLLLSFRGTLLRWHYYASQWLHWWKNCKIFPKLDERGKLKVDNNINFIIFTMKILTTSPIFHLIEFYIPLKWCVYKRKPRISRLNQICSF